MSGVLTLWIPVPPDNANAREHWAVAAKRKKTLIKQLDQRAAIRHHIPPAPDKPIACAEILVEWYYPDMRWHLDPDNAIRRLKPVADWLVRNGYLAGDTMQHVRWLPVVEHVGMPTPEMCSVHLTITPIAA